MDPKPPTSGTSQPESKSTTAPRKRRRRTVASGAADDCFTCRKRQSKCDRKRPYCGQCLEIGKDCSGYKTTLTWGVGVASRGKLRGLTCPVAEQGSVEAGVTKRASTTQRRKSSVSVRTGSIPVTLPSASGVQATRTGSEDLLLPLYPRQNLWQPSQQYSSFDSQAPPAFNDDYPVDPYLNTGFNKPPEYPQTPTSISWSDTSPTYPNHQYQDLLSQQDTRNFSQPADQYPDSVQDVLTESSAAALQQLLFSPVYNLGNSEHDDYLAGGDEGTSRNGISFPENHQSLVSRQNISSTIPRNILPSMFCQLPPRLQYLLDYYDKNICSVLVAFDDSINPYRMHILQLASQNEGLQNALAALSLNNMRMRLHKRSSASGFVQELSETDPPEKDDALFQPTPEEMYYKSMSIGKLQSQLGDPKNAQDDSVLAILLILCLFHVCDSGFSKFKTQLEGVQKLLSMRDPHVRSGFIGWVEMFFAWFDVMTSTVNDRETEIQGDRLDMLHYSSNLGALEQFSGCDGRLFKLIARLGRLNLLSQNRPVRADGRKQWAPNAPPSGRKPKDARTRAGRSRMHFDPMDFGKLDGNGWGSLVVSSDEESADMENDFRDPKDTRHEFWSEWHDIRSRLESWSMDQLSLDPSMPLEPAQLEPGQRDLIHINESFRSSALLYTERLAHPYLPSSSPEFQTHVRTALSHIAALEVTSCVNKFLLWPLFIAGTECVDPGDQALVRDRCIEIQIESGFFNNISVLDVLEKVWADDVENEEVSRRKECSQSEGEGVQAFRWRKAMDRVDGEYIVV